jgi:hypothetical protein
MNKLKKAVLLVSISLLGTISTYAQRGRGEHHSNGNRQMRTHNGYRPNNRIVVRSKFRPVNVVVYHPHWRPNYEYHRRWVYFPRYNFYWDNWRQGYYYRNGPVWIFNTTPPPVIVNVKIENEKNYELKEQDDDVDDVYKTNDNHQQEFKTDTIK